MLYVQNFDYRFFLSSFEKKLCFFDDGDVIMIVSFPYHQPMFCFFCYAFSSNENILSNLNEMFFHEDLNDTWSVSLKNNFSMSLGFDNFQNKNRYLLQIHKEKFSLHTILCLHQMYQNGGGVCTSYKQDKEEENHIDIITTSLFSQKKKLQIPIEKEKQLDRSLFHLPNHMEIDLEDDLDIHPNVVDLREYLFLV